MNRNETKALVIEALECYAEDFRPDYSGRGMYGRECIGVVCDSLRDFMRLVHEVVCMVENDGGCPHDATSILADVSTDGMGLSTIYYFTGLRK